MKYGNLTVIDENAGVSKHQKKLWRCLCDCGKETIAIASQIKSGKTRSCGHLKSAGNRRTHGLRQKNKGKQTPTYTAWCNMKARCTKESHIQWKDYGGRGISYAPRWEFFENFLRDMGEKPKGLTLGRIDNDGNYCPENCRWETKRQQSTNTRQNRNITFNGKTKTLVEWAEIAGVPYMTFYYRLHRGMDMERALSSNRDMRYKDSN